MAGEVTGRVTDDVGAPLEDVLVSIELAPDVAATSFTLESGRYTLLGIPEGTYPVTASKVGYAPASVSDVAVTAGNATEVDFVLIPETKI